MFGKYRIGNEKKRIFKKTNSVVKQVLIVICIVFNPTLRHRTYYSRLFTFVYLIFSELFYYCFSHSVCTLTLYVLDMRFERVFDSWDYRSYTKTSTHIFTKTTWQINTVLFNKHNIAFLTDINRNSRSHYSHTHEMMKNISRLQLCVTAYRAVIRLLMKNQVFSTMFQMKLLFQWLSAVMEFTFVESKLVKVRHIWKYYLYESTK